MFPDSPIIWDEYVKNANSIVHGNLNRVTTTKKYVYNSPKAEVIYSAEGNCPEEDGLSKKDSAKVTNEAEKINWIIGDNIQEKSSNEINTKTGLLQANLVV